jgi:RNA polymerase sigma-70 factor (ECF subfamily)
VLAPTGFAAFFQQEYARLVLFLIKNGAGEADAEDAAQEAMAEAIRAWERIEKPRAWVRRVALRIYVRRALKERRDDTVPLDDETHGARSGQPDATTIEEEQCQVVALMRRLPPAQRTVIALYYDGFTHDEIADVIDKPAATVRSTLRHARAHLKEVIQSETARIPGFES